MYCSECNLRVADDTILICPVCQGPLQLETDDGEKSAFPDLVNESPVSREQEVAPEDKFDDCVNDVPEFDPEKFGLKSFTEKDPAEGVDDMQTLSDLWGKEGIEADLDGAFSEALMPETGDLKPVETAADSRPQKSMQVNSGLFSDYPSKQKTNWLPLLLFVGLILMVAGGWFYTQNRGVTSATNVSGKTGSSEFVESQPKVEKSYVINKEVKDVKDVAGPAEVLESAVVEPIDDSQLGDKPDAEEAAVVAGQMQADFTDSQAVVANPQSSVEIVDKPVDKQVVTLSEAPASSRVDSESVIEPDKNSAGSKRVDTEATMRKSAEPIPVQKKATEEIDLIKAITSPETALTDTRYVVQIGSFRSEDGTLHQLAMLQQKGFAAYRMEVDLGKKGVWQRVFVPGGALKSDALSVQKKLKTLFPREKSLIRKLKK